MSKQRLNAIVTGYSLIAMAALAGFSFGYAMPIFFDVNNFETPQLNIEENIGVYILMLIGIVIIIILDILVSWTIYQFFKIYNNSIAIISFILRILYTVAFSVGTYFLFKNIVQGVKNELLNSNFNSFETIWTIGLIVFGLHLIGVGILMKVQSNIPKILWMVTLIAGISYFVVHLLKSTLPELSDFTETLNNVLALPMVLGEIGLAIWLIAKGGKNQRI